MTICTPTANATVTSPVHIVAGTTDSKTVQFIQIYVDGVKKYEIKAKSLDTSLAMSAGTHRLTVQAYDGTYFKQTIFITVSGGGGGGGCTASTVNPSVTICTPAPNATVTSPVHVVAVTTDSKTVRLSCCCFRVLERGKDADPNFASLYKVCHARIDDGLCHRTSRLGEYNEHCKANGGEMFSFQSHCILQPLK